MLFNKMVGGTSAFGEIQEKIKQFAPTDWAVLVLGETGVGKELVARAIHENSLRAKHPFVVVNCGALPQQLFESELFGHERGAFSGALQSARGLVRAAQGGTLFLDEIGDLEMSQQVKLLRLIENREVRAVGSARTEVVDVRVVAATNCDLDQAVVQKSFRQDLKERLSVLTLRLPPLRSRTEDIQPIAEFYLAQLGVTATRLDCEPLLNWDWPGNIRQLKNLLIRASIQPSSTPLRDRLSQLVSEEAALWARAQALRPDTDTFNSGSLSDIEKHVIVQRLRVLGGNRKRTAEDLGIAKSTLHDKLRKWREDVPLPAPNGQ